MVNIEVAKRLIKRIALANITTTKKDLFLTPLLCGRHGIGKSQVIKQIADELGGYCITVEGGVLKEGEITGIPYQSKDENGKIIFRFLPYYAIERIQNEEKRLFEASKYKNREFSILKGDENRYSLNDITPQEKIDMLLNKKVKPVFIFIDEINRTENSVYKELMNILLTRTVNGYVFPWWVFFVGAMNPSTLGSMYATNEMDPAQLDRFVKINVSVKVDDWVRYARKNNIDDEIINFIAEHPHCLVDNKRGNDDEEEADATPRGWDMCDTILKSIPLLRNFFTASDNTETREKSDIKQIFISKLGGEVAMMYFEAKKDSIKPIKPDEIFRDDTNLTAISERYNELTPAKVIQSVNLLVDYFKDSAEDFVLSEDLDDNKQKLRKFISLLDSSNKLLLGQQLVDINVYGQSLILKLYDVFEEELIDVLDLDDELRKLVSRL